MSTLLSSRYHVLQVIGEGAFGKTFLAEDIHMPTRRRCVVKQLKPIAQVEIYQLVQERFEREAALLEILGESNNQIPKLYAYFAELGRFYLVQEWIEGKTLTKRLFEDKQLSQEVVNGILMSLLSVLEYIHSRNIIHRDIKPDNIIIRQGDGKPVLIDFGVVKEVMKVDALGNPTSSIVAGTPDFMALEQVGGKPVFASDLYSLGMTAISLLTGKMPKEMINPLTGEISWRTHASVVEDGFASILDRATKPSFSDRYKTALEMLESLQCKVNIERTIIANPSPVPRSSFRINFGAHKFDRITKKGEKDTYNFEAQAGDVIVIRLVDRNASSGQPLHWQPHIELRDGVGSIISEMSSAVETRIGPEVLSTSGTFSIIVSHGITKDNEMYTGIGDYVLFLQRVNNPGLSKPLDSEDELMGLLNHGGQVHTYTFNAHTEDQVTLTMTKEEKGGIYPLLELYDRKGRAIDIVHSYSPVGSVDPAIIERPLNIGGTYTILASSYFGNQVGIYRISLRIETKKTIPNALLESTLLINSSEEAVIPTKPPNQVEGKYLGQIMRKDGSVEVFISINMGLGGNGKNFYVYTSANGTDKREISIDDVSRIKIIEPSRIIDDRRTWQKAIITLCKGRILENLFINAVGNWYYKTDVWGSYIDENVEAITFNVQA